jgi:hypothetical protein
VLHGSRSFLLSPDDYALPLSGFRPRYSLAGYEPGLAALNGRSVGTVHLGWRFPIAQIERGWVGPPLGVDRIYGRALFESGSAWDVGQIPRSSVGLELDLILVLGYSVALPLSLGWAHGLDAGGVHEFYIRFAGIEGKAGSRQRGEHAHRR